MPEYTAHWAFKLVIILGNIHPFSRGDGGSGPDGPRSFLPAPPGGARGHQNHDVPTLLEPGPHVQILSVKTSNSPRHCGIALPDHTTLPLYVLLCGLKSRESQRMFLRATPCLLVTSMSWHVCCDSGTLLISSLSAPLSIPLLLLSFSPLFPSQMLQVLSVDVSVTSLPLPFFPSPPSLRQLTGMATPHCVFLALPQMGLWQHVRDQNVLYLSCQAILHDQNWTHPPVAGDWGGGGSLSSTLLIEVLTASCY